jgi:hypothetical protein
MFLFMLGKNFTQWPKFEAKPQLYVAIINSQLNTLLFFGADKYYWQAVDCQQL